MTPFPPLTEIWAVIESRLIVLAILLFVDVIFGVVLALVYKEFKWEKLTGYITSDLLPIFAWIAVAILASIPQDLLPPSTPPIAADIVYGTVFLKIMASVLGHFQRIGIIPDTLAKLGIGKTTDSAIAGLIQYGPRYWSTKVPILKTVMVTIPEHVQHRAGRDGGMIGSLAPHDPPTIIVIDLAEHDAGDYRIFSVNGWEPVPPNWYEKGPNTKEPIEKQEWWIDGKGLKEPGSGQLPDVFNFHGFYNFTSNQGEIIRDEEPKG